MDRSGKLELFRRHPANPILRAEEWPYPVNSVFNAGATTMDGQTLLLVRVEDRRGMSHLCVARSTDGVTDWQIDPAPTFHADPRGHPEELWGVEDPRITFVEQTGEYLIAYASYGEAGTLVALARTKDFKSYERLGPVMPPDNKDAAVFPVRFNGKWVMIHRPASPNPAVKTVMWLSFSPDLKHWGGHRLLMRSRGPGWWDTRRIGLSTPPVLTEAGWLISYHGVRPTAAGETYRVGLALLDRDDPVRVLRRSDEWIFSPREVYERQGDVEQVVFPCGWVVDGDEIRLYYGGADTCIALATGSVQEVLDHLLGLPPYESHRPTRS